MQAIGRVIGRPIRVELMEWREAQERVLRGEADALTDLAVSEERRKLYDFGSSRSPTNSVCSCARPNRDDSSASTISRAGASG